MPCAIKGHHHYKAGGVTFSQRLGHEQNLLGGTESIQWAQVSPGFLVDASFETSGSAGERAFREKNAPRL